MTPPSSSSTSTSTSSSSAAARKANIYCEFTIKTPEFSYAHLQLATDSFAASAPMSSSCNNSSPLVVLDELLVKSYCTNALRQHLGLSGAAMPLDILKVADAECWLRVPRDDLASLAAALTAFAGAVDNGTTYVLRIKRCSDWLGTIV